MSHLLIEGYILEIGHGKMEYSLTIYLITKKFQPNQSVHARTGAKIVLARPFLHTKTNFRDWLWKDGILIDYISNHKKNFSNIGACTCAQEPKKYVRGRFCILMPCFLKKLCTNFVTRVKM